MRDFVPPNQKGSFPKIFCRQKKKEKKNLENFFFDAVNPSDGQCPSSLEVLWLIKTSNKFQSILLGQKETRKIKIG